MAARRQHLTNRPDSSDRMTQVIVLAADERELRNAAKRKINVSLKVNQTFSCEFSLLFIRHLLRAGYRHRNTAKGTGSNQPTMCESD